VSARRLVSTFAVLSSAILTGCGGPNEANIALRKQNAELREKLADAERIHAGDRATIESLQNQRGTLPTLPQNRLEKLFTVHGLAIGRLTTADEKGLRVYVNPTDEAGDAIKAAGTFTVDLFDLSIAQNNRIGHWEFDAKQSRDAWLNAALIRSFVLECPWQTRPAHRDLTIRVTFKDELTQRIVTAQKEIHVSEMPATQPTTRYH
jgi:hypothetical protein